MGRCSPYHTDSPEYPPEHREVYHNRDDCPDGERIKSWHRKAGMGNKKPCKECMKLG